MPSPRLLLAEDHPQLRHLLREALEAEGMRVVGEAGTGIDAITEAERLEPDVVVMDNRMPEMGGVEATLRIAQRGITVVAFVTLDEPRIGERMLGAGAVAIVRKGFGVRELAAAIRAAFAAPVA